MRKAIIFTIAFIIPTTILFAQKVELIKVTGVEYPEFIAKNQYKYPSYTRAKISFKNGDVGSARINYNNFMNTIRYLNERNDTLEIANPQDINYIAVGLDTLFYDNAYYQWIASSAIARLAVRHDYKEAHRALTGAFGASSPAKRIEAVDKVFAKGSFPTTLALDETVTFSKESTYFISITNDSKMNFVPVTRKNLNKLFPKKNLDNFIEEKKININKEEDLIDLLVYVSKSR